MSVSITTQPTDVTQRMYHEQVTTGRYSCNFLISVISNTNMAASQTSEAAATQTLFNGMTCCVVM